MARKRRIAKRTWKEILGIGKWGLVAVGGFFVVQGALALFPEITGSVSIVVGFAILLIAGFLGWRNRR